ncbi:unnamed protein product [Sympodiomycopsis kandeliae]
MATLDKLAIRGVRSFDDKSINIIEFFTPLTVIVGYNGSGKTTIIECLKYATTGDMPPNTKGGAFVHDPKMAAANEVKAQIRLRFFSTNKTRMNCVRNLQVTVKKAGGLTLKTLEGVLSVDDAEKSKNKRATLSTRCAELDEEMPRLLGVSRAVLDNVIFCHQEDSNWPLSDASTLKKKFDDIFDATRYTKALENIKTIRKGRAADLRVQNAELESLKKDRDTCDQLKEKRSQLIGSLTQKQVTLDKLNEEIRILADENKRIYDTVTKFRETVSNAENIEKQKDMITKSRDNLKVSMKSMDQADEELAKRLDSFDDHLAKLRRRRADLEHRIQSQTNDLKEVQSRYSKQLSLKGALENDKEHHEKAIARREQQIRQVSVELGIRGFDVEGLTDDQVHDFTRRLTESTRSAEDELSATKAEGSSKDAELSTKLQDLRAQRSGQVASRETVARNSKQLKEKMKLAEEDIDRLGVPDTDIVIARETVEENIKKVDRLRKEIETANFDSEIRKKDSEIKELDGRRDELTMDLNALNRHADYRAKLEMKKKDSEQKAKAIRALLDRSSSSFNKYIDHDPTEATFEKDVNRSASLKDQEVLEAERKEAEKNREVQHLESTVSISRSQLKEKKDQLEQLSQAVKTFLDTAGTEEKAASVQDAIDEAEASVQNDSDALADSSSAYDLFERILNTGKSQKMCIGCGRGIQQAELSNFEKYVTSKIKHFSPEGRKELESNIRDWKAILTQARDLLPKEQMVKQLKEVEIPALEQRIKSQTSDLTDKSQIAEKATATLRALKDEQHDLANLKKNATEIVRLSGEVKSLNEDVTQLESDLASTGSTQTGDQIQDAINDLADSIKRLKRELNLLERNRDSKREELNNAERAVTRSEKSLAEKEDLSRRREMLQKRIDELRSEYHEASDRLKELDQSIDGLNDPIKKMKEELETMRNDMEREEGRQSTRVKDLQSKLSKLKEAEAQISNYTSSGGPRKLTECVTKIKDLQEEVSTVQEGIKTIEGDIAGIDKDLNQSEATRRNIQDNLNYRQMGRDLEKLDEELDGLDLEYAAKMRAEYGEKHHKAEEHRTNLTGDAHRLAGEISGNKTEIEAREEELRKNYQNIHKDFAKKLVEVKTSEIGNADLEKYAKALDAAIIRFHGLKMAEINDQIKYLWSKTYQGTDIDSISIKSDTEKVGNRSYNYRVVMMKDLVEMDMRGRCSAGQKVLASIIIRLALADSFAMNCKFMALDEPTLCLDQETVEALARSLSDIIKERPNTQLLVVTHDPQFLNLLAQSTNIDYYWRVSRDQDMKSIIEREKIR